MDPEFARVRALVFEPYTLFRVPAIAGRQVNVSDHGYRLGQTPAPWPPDPAVENVFVFGGSTAFGYGVADADTIPAQLAGMLADLARDKRFHVYNFATPNHICVQERVRLEQLLLSGCFPRIAIFIDGFDEFIAPYYAPVMLKPFFDATSAKSASQRLGRAAKEMLSGLLRSADGNDGEGQLPDASRMLDQYVSNARMIRAVCREFSVAPLFVWQPVPCYEYDGEDLHGTGTGKRLIDSVRAGYRLMNARRADQFSGADCLWLADIQRGQTGNLYVDADHYSARFSREIASQIARHLVEHRFFG
jgi:hypothetical protein